LIWSKNTAIAFKSAREYAEFFAFEIRRANAQADSFANGGLSATLDELLLAAEYIMAEEISDVILCERGIRTFGGARPQHARLSIVPSVH
jgi:hypothetical protein